MSETDWELLAHFAERSGLLVSSARKQRPDEVVALSDEAVEAILRIAGSLGVEDAVRTRLRARLSS